MLRSDLEHSGTNTYQVAPGAGCFSPRFTRGGLFEMWPQVSELGPGNEEGARALWQSLLNDTAAHPELRLRARAALRGEAAGAAGAPR